MKILLAEDDASISTILSMVLEQFSGHAVDLAADGKQAIEMLQQNHYDLILLDSMMPYFDGLQVCKVAREHFQVTAPIIFLSAKTAEENKKKCIEVGGSGYIEKPFDPTLIWQQIESILQRAAS
jgi:DNA-binding response OmpR family regulator